jgi:acyl-CoA thioesterase-1
LRNLLVGIVLTLSAPAMAEQVTVAALGDSLTQGFGLPPEEGFVPQLEGWLRGEGADVSVVNAGVSGDTTAGGLSRIAWTLTDDVNALIVTLGGNDLLRAIPPEASRANLDAILETALARGVSVLLVGMEAPGNFGPKVSNWIKWRNFSKLTAFTRMPRGSNGLLRRWGPQFCNWWKTKQSLAQTG